MLISMGSANDGLAVVSTSSFDNEVGARSAKLIRIEKRVAASFIKLCDHPQNGIAISQVLQRMDGLPSVQDGIKAKSKSEGQG